MLFTWLDEVGFTLAGFEREQNAEGQPVDFTQTWLCTLDTDPIPELMQSKLRNARPQRYYGYQMGRVQG